MVWHFPTRTGTHSRAMLFNLEEEVRSISNAKLMATPLVLVLIPIVIVNLLLEVIISMCIRINPLKKNPDASAGVPGATPLPKRTSYIGDFFGFLSFMKLKGDLWIVDPNSPSPSDGQPDEDVTVRVHNFGFPCVTVNDVKASKSFIDIDHREQCRLLCPYTTFLESTRPNIYRKGERAAMFRKLLTSIVPNEENGEQFKTAVKEMKQEAKKWIDAHQGPDQDKEDFVFHCVNGFNSVLLLGEPMPVEIVNAVKKGFAFLSPFPRFFPPFLFPPYHGMLKAREHFHARVKASPRWHGILSVANDAGLTPSEACDGIISILCFNGIGLVDSFNIALDFLPHFHYGKMMMKDARALESFAWETLRFNGPGAMMPAKDEPTIIETSAGKKYAVKKGTILSSSFESVQIDNAVWPDAQSFPADRYLKSTSTTTKINPWPTITFGMPLGSINDRERNYKTHSCVMGHLGHRILEAFVTMMADPSFEYTLPGFDGKKFMGNMRHYIHNRAKSIEFKKK